jgi:hypothetical protein
MRLGGSGFGEEQQLDANVTPLAMALAWRGELRATALMDEEATRRGVGVARRGRRDGLGTLLDSMDTSMAGRPPGYLSGERL